MAATLTEVTVPAARTKPAKVWEELMQYVPYWIEFKAEKDSEPRNADIKHTYDKYPPPGGLPLSLMVTRQMGSLEEHTYLNKNGTDIDTLYEFGPGVCEDIDGSCNKDEHSHGHTFYLFTETEHKHKGYYIIRNNHDEYIYPKELQRSVAPQLLEGDKDNVFITQRIPPKHIPPVQQVDMYSGSIEDARKDDHVPAMRLNDWPDDVFENTKEQLKWCSKVKDNLRGIPLFFIRKAHPSRDNPVKKLEWRLVFPLVEVEIMLALPSVYKKAYLFCKALNKSFSINKEHPLKTYHLKTSLMWLMDKYFEEDNTLETKDVFGVIRELFSYLEEASRTKTLKNYFIPDMNVFEKFEEKDFAEANELLKQLLSTPDILPREIWLLIPKLMYENDKLTFVCYFTLEEIKSVDEIKAYVLLDAYTRLVHSIDKGEYKDMSDKVDPPGTPDYVEPSKQCKSKGRDSCSFLKRILHLYTAIPGADIDEALENLDEYLVILLCINKQIQEDLSNKKENNERIDAEQIMADIQIYYDHTLQTGKQINKWCEMIVNYLKSFIVITLSNYGYNQSYCSNFAQWRCMVKTPRLDHTMCRGAISHPLCPEGSKHGLSLEAVLKTPIEIYKDIIKKQIAFD